MAKIIGVDGGHYQENKILVEMTRREWECLRCSYPYKHFEPKFDVGTEINISEIYASIVEVLSYFSDLRGVFLKSHQQIGKIVEAIKVKFPEKK